jgi:hypothetical protein
MMRATNPDMCGAAKLFPVMREKLSKTVDQYHLVDDRFTTIRGRQINHNSPGLHQIDSRAWILLTEENFPLIHRRYSASC